MYDQEFYCQNCTTELRLRCSALDTACVPDGASHTGEVASGYIRLSGHLIQATYTNGTLMKPAKSLIPKTHYWGFSFYDDGRMSLQEEAKVYILWVAEYEGDGNFP